MRPILAKILSVAKWWGRLELFHRQRGLIIAHWAAAETSIDLANSYAWEYSDRTISKVVPMNLRWKLELFERIHRKLIPFTGLRKQAARILTQIKALQDDRHWLTHGTIVPVYREADGWILRKGEFQRDGSVKFAERHFTASELVAIERSVRKLSMEIARYTYAVGRQIRDDASDDQGS